MGSSGHTWILLRGLVREKGHWGHFLDQFAQAFPNDEVLALDLPGSGEHLDVASPKTISGIFNYVRAEAIARAKQQSQFKILALSLGGMVAMEWLRQRGEDLSACVLINSSTKNVSPFYNRLRWQVYRDVIRLLSVQSTKERERGIVNLVMNNQEAKDVALPQWIKIAGERPIPYSTLFNQITAASLYKGLEENEGTKVPTLLLNGLGDHLVDPSCSTKLHEHNGWPIRRHPWAGHDLTWDDPQWVIDQVVAWEKELVTLGPGPEPRGLRPEN